jgi:predicted ABC-type sugar transport system permease subunit
VLQQPDIRSEQYVVTLTVVDAAGNSDISVINMTMEAESLPPTWTLVIIGVVTIISVIIVYRRRLIKSS